MARRKVFIEEMNCFGEEVDFTLTCNDNDAFLEVWDIETLERVLKTRLEHENYEMAELVNKHIKIKQEKMTGKELDLLHECISINSPSKPSLPNRL